jgi:hypothetical protein
MDSPFGAVPLKLAETDFQLRRERGCRLLDRVMKAAFRRVALLLLLFELAVPFLRASAQVKVELDLSALVPDSSGRNDGHAAPPAGLRWIFLDPSEVFSPFLPAYLRPSWQVVPEAVFFSIREQDSLRMLGRRLLDSLRSRGESLVQELETGLARGLWREIGTSFRCALFLHPTEPGRYWAGASEGLAFSLTPYVRTSPDIRLDWPRFQADLLEACYELLASQLLIQGDLLLEATGDHAAIREDLISKYGFGVVSLASRALGLELHHRDPDRLKALVERWAQKVPFDPRRASQAAEFFRQTMWLGMANWLSAPWRGIPDSAIYLYQLRPWYPSLKRDLDQFHRGFRLSVVQGGSDHGEVLRQLAENGTLARIGFYMARRIEYVFGRGRLLGDFSRDEVSFFLDYLSLQGEADLRFDEGVCGWVFDLADQMERLRRLASEQ